VVRTSYARANCKLRTANIQASASNTQNELRGFPEALERRSPITTGWMPSLLILTVWHTLPCFGWLKIQPTELRVTFQLIEGLQHPPMALAKVPSHDQRIHHQTIAIQTDHVIRFFEDEEVVTAYAVQTECRVYSLCHARPLSEWRPAAELASSPAAQ